MLSSIRLTAASFLSTPSARRATRCCHPSGLLLRHFYPRPPRGGRQFKAVRSAWCAGYFYPRPPRGGRQCSFFFDGQIDVISIHALREEGDLAAVPSIRENLISIHALREEGDGFGAQTPSGGYDFYPRPPRGGRRAALLGAGVPVSISIHALREEGDRMPSTSFSRSSDFYPRPPRGGRRGLPPRCCCRA